MEGETGQRIDSNDGDNMAMAGLFGAIAREMGKSNHERRDDIVAGVVIRHQMSPEHEREQQSKKMLGKLLMAGFSPEEARRFLDLV